MFEEGLVIFSGKDCPACKDLKNKLNSEGKVYKEFDIWSDTEALKFMASKGLRSIPQMFLDGENITNA